MCSAGLSLASIWVMPLPNTGIWKVRHLAQRYLVTDG